MFCKSSVQLILSKIMFGNISTCPLKQRVAVCQMNSTDDKERNIRICTELINESYDKEAKIVFLPECFDYIAENKTDSVKMAESLEGDIIKHYKNLAKEKSLWLSMGGFHEKCSTSDGSIFNSHIIINANGELVSVYRKVHLFDVDIPGTVLKESSYVTPGKKIEKPVDTPVGKIGLLCCYDLRFPEISIVNRQLGAQILTFPSAFTFTTGLAHWHVLLRARAIENQCYVIAAAQTGKHNDKRTSYGHALIVDPWGKVVAECEKENGVCVASIDLSLVDSIRESMPVFEHRRYDLYNNPLKNLE
ncbi:deaminated glutathione amidase [Hydra vulgaris]|uniref:Nitrilase homolog 1 n=1 Tax=Hydra vulgaris TaxID=6087 RepID=T2M9Q8_HYDVU|nr:deaminated glutathione amidase [Hydra vulgaris]